LKKGNRTIEVAVNGPLIANDFPTLLGAALEGIGLAQLPRPIVAPHIEAGRLAEVLPDLAPTTPGVFLYFPSHRQMLPKLRAFVDHVKARGAASRRSAARSRS
jgi:DNA-binding transcriptional LysR family regulator